MWHREEGGVRWGKVAGSGGQVAVVGNKAVAGKCVMFVGGAKGQAGKGAENPRTRGRRKVMHVCKGR